MHSYSGSAEDKPREQIDLIRWNRLVVSISLYVVHLFSTYTKIIRSVTIRLIVVGGI